jgi:hypothetical protein
MDHAAHPGLFIWVRPMCIDRLGQLSCVCRIVHAVTYKESELRLGSIRGGF